jgi:hypothetical protein
VDQIYDTQGFTLGHVASSGKVTDRHERTIGRVHNAGGGEVWKSGVVESLVGEVFSNGTVSARHGSPVGKVQGTRVYDGQGLLVGTVNARTDTTWITGISNAHKAGAALLLLLR